MADDKQINTVRRSLKRKLEESFTVFGSSSSQQQQDDDLLIKIRELIEVLETNSSDRALLKRSIQILSELAKNEDNVNLLVGSGVVPALVKHLQEPQWPNEAVIGFDEFVTHSRPLEHEVEKGSAFTLGLLAIKPEHQQLIVDAGALPHLVALLKRHRDNRTSRVVNGVIREAVGAITNLARRNGSIKTRVKVEGGIPPLVELLESNDAEVQRVVAKALLIFLASKNEENKTQIVDHNFLPTLISMLQSEDTDIQYEAVRVIGDLVNSSSKIKMDVLHAGALQPVIKLLSSTCLESQRKAALILRQFAAAPEHQQLIVDARALPHLVVLLKRHRDNQNSEVVNRVIRIAVDVITNLARENGSIKTRVRVEGGIPPLVELLESNDAKVQRAAVGALRVLASKNDENMTQIVDHNALPTLVLMLQSKDNGIHYKAVSVIGYLVDSSPKIKMDVLHAGALQPLIKLLSSTSTCLESQRIAALLLEQFAPEHQQLIVDAGALPHLVALLKRHRDNQNSRAVNGVIRKVVDAITNLAIDNDRSKICVRVEGGIPPLVELLNSNDAKVQRAAARALCILTSTNDENKTQIVDHNALPTLVSMLQSEDTDIHYEAVCVIGNLVNSSPKINTDVLHAGALQPVIKLLSSTCLESQRKAALILRQFAAASEHQQLIVDAGALPHLVALLKRHRDNQDSRAVNGVIREVVDAITNLAYNNDRSKTCVRVEGGIPPLVELLKSNDAKVQRIAAWALCILTSTNDENKTQIVDHNALPALALMLESEDTSIHYEAVCVIGNLANSSPKIKMYVLHGALQPLVKLLSSTCLESQRKAALLLGQFAVDNDIKDNVADLVSVGGVQKLMDGEFIDQPTRDCVAKILKRMEDKIHGKVLSRLLYKMHNAEKIVQKRIVLALAHFCSPDDQEAIFVDNNGLDLLLEILQSVHAKHQGDACAALCRLAEKATSVSPVAGPSSPKSQVYLGEEYVNNPMVSDVTFIVEGKRFYAHRVVLLASSDAFRAMFDGGYKERDAKDVQIPNISWETFELMMRFIYTGSVEVNMGIAKDLLKAADQYLLDGLKRLCEYTMAQDIKADNLALMYDLSETSNAVSLRNACILFVLEQFDELDSKPWYASFILQILPEIRNYFMTTLTKPIEANSQEY